MKTARFVSGFLAVVFLISAGADLIAQEEEDGHVFVVSTFKMRFDKVDDVVDVWMKEYRPINDQIEEILDIKILRHFYGPDWSIMVITEYASFSDIEVADRKFDELFKKKYPDEKKRAEIFESTAQYASGHWDAILTEMK